MGVSGAIVRHIIRELQTMYYFINKTSYFQTVPFRYLVEK